MTFFLPQGQKIERFDIFRGNFPNPYPNRQKIFDPDPSLD